MQLTPKAEQMLRKFAAGLAKANGQVDTSRYFSLTNPKETQLRNALLQSSEFLRLLPNVLDVDQITGQVVSTGKPGIYTGRKKDGRFSRALGVSGNEYKLVETDSGSYLPYSLLVVWANAGSEEEFFQRIQAFSNESFALDMLRVAFNGTSVAEDTARKPTRMAKTSTSAGTKSLKTVHLSRLFLMPSLSARRVLTLLVWMRQSLTWCTPAFMSHSAMTRAWLCWLPLTLSATTPPP